MTTPHARQREQFSFDDVETTEPDLRLTYADFLPPADEDDDAAAFTEAKTEPARPIDEPRPIEEFPEPDTLRDEPQPRSASRDETLLAFRETVRRVFGQNG